MDEHCTDCGCTLSAKGKCLSCECPLEGENKKWGPVVTYEENQEITKQLEYGSSKDQESPN